MRPIPLRFVPIKGRVVEQEIWVEGDVPPLSEVLAAAREKVPILHQVAGYFVFMDNVPVKPEAEDSLFPKDATLTLLELPIKV